MAEAVTLSDTYYGDSLGVIPLLNDQEDFSARGVLNLGTKRVSDMYCFATRVQKGVAARIR